MRAASTGLAASLFALLFAAAAFAQTPSYEFRFQSAGVKIRECESTVGDWKLQALIAGILLGVIALSGATTAAIQGVKRPWRKRVTVALGAIVSLVSVISTATLDGDFKTLNRRARDGDRLVKTADDWLQGRDTVKTDDDRDVILQEIEKRIKAFWQLATEQHDTQGQTQGALFETVVYAEPAAGLQSSGCGCLQPYAPNRSYMFFCGTATAGSVGEARSAAGARAFAEATRALSQNPQQTAQSRAGGLDAYVRRVAAEADSCVRPARGQYTAAVLLRVARALASPEAQTAFVPTIPRVAQMRVPSAVGQRTIAAAERPGAAIVISVTANNARDGDFVFNFHVDRAAQRTLVLDNIRVNQDGSFGDTAWSFTILVNGAQASAIDETTYSDAKQPPVFVPPRSVSVAIAGDAIVEVRGFRR